MAPEQTGGQLIDTRADVYALGAILYELTCGRPPIEMTGDPLALLGRIRDAVPPPASRVRASNASESGLEVVSRSTLVDLDCILARALEKEPARRYTTVAAFSEDLRRVLRGDPIEARPATIRYRAARFAQRNKVLVGSVAMVAAALLIGIVGLTTGLFEAQRQRREAIDQSDARGEVNRFLTEDLLAASSPFQQGESVTALDLLHRASRRVDERFSGRPLTAAAIHYALGTSFMELGAFEDAARHLDRAIDLRRRFAGADAPDTVRSEIAVASLLAQRERPSEAEAAFLLAIPRARRILGTKDPVLYSALNDLGTNYLTMDKGQEALSTLTEALDGRTRLLGARDPQVLVTAANIAQAYDHLGQTKRALELEIETLRVADSLEESPRMTVLGLCNNIGATYQDLNQDSDAAPYVRRAADLARQCLGPENPATLTIRANLAGLEVELGDPLRGAEMYDEVVNARTRILGPDASDTISARYGYWNALWHGKKFEQAASGLRLLLDDAARALGDDHGLTIQTRVMLAHALLNAGRPLDAMPLAQRATQQLLAIHGPDDKRTTAAAQLIRDIEAVLLDGTLKQNRVIEEAQK